MRGVLNRRRVSGSVGHYLIVAFYVRRLPHWQPQDTEFFVTWRLHGSLPRQVHHCEAGPLWLKNPRVAECVSEILLTGETKWRFYDLPAWVVMANHVHVPLRPLIPHSKALMNIKSASARAANSILQRKGEPFWQGESYDHWVRSDEERTSIIRYIHFNPVTAGLVSEPEEWPWSSAGRPRMAPRHNSVILS
jgi:REP element-mobilizing transposase RayT